MQLAYIFSVVLRGWVCIIWYIQIACDMLRKKRELFLSINDLTVIYNNDGLMVLDKSPELLINSNRPWYYCVTLQIQIFFAFPHLANFNLEHMYYFVNRLDSPTSGLICVAYTKQACGLTGRAFQNHTVSKRYLAIVWGHVNDDCLVKASKYDVRVKYDSMGAYKLTSPISKEMRPSCTKIGDHQYFVELALGDFQFIWPNGRSQAIMAPSYVSGCYRPRASQTKVTVIKHGYLNERPASYLLLEPKSGRRHQLRLHTAVGLGGHPIAGDIIYSCIFSNEEDEKLSDHKLSRMMLHAHSLDLCLVPKQPFVKVYKKQERVNNSHPEPINLHLKSSRNILVNSNGTWRDETIFRSIE